MARKDKGDRRIKATIQKWPKPIFRVCMCPVCEGSGHLAIAKPKEKIRFEKCGVCLGDTMITSINTLQHGGPVIGERP